MKKWLLPLVAFLFIGTCPVRAQIAVKAAPSETVELMYVMMLLTDVDAINAQKILPEYKAFVDSWFATYKNHSAIRFIVKKLMNKHGLQMSTPAEIGVDSEIVDGVFVYTGNGFGWSNRIRDRFVKEVNKFYRDTDFHAFWEEARDNLYPLVDAPFNDVIIPKLNFGWLNGFVPVRDTLNYGLTISLLGGELNYGATKHGVPNPVIGIMNIGLVMNPTPKTLETYLPVILHEYLHPFCNPLIDRYYAELEGPGEVIFPKIREQMTKASYGEWRFVLYEAFVRASVIAFMRSDDFFRSSVEAGIEEDKSMGFY